MPSRFVVLLALAAHEPEEELQARTKLYLERLVKVAEPDTKYENYILYLLHLIANHVDFSDADDDLALFAKNVELFVDAIANADNVSLLYHMCAQAKTIRMKGVQHSEVRQMIYS